MVLADSHGISRAPWYSGVYQEANAFRIQDFHLLWYAIQTLLLYIGFVTL